MIENNVDSTNSNVKFLKLTSASLSLFAPRISHTLKIKSLYGDMIVSNASDKSALEVKSYLCGGTSIDPKDILFVSLGKEVHDEESMCAYCHNGAPRIFAMIRSGAKSMVSISVNYSGGQNSNHIAEFPASTKLFHFKRELWSRKLIPWRPTRLRLIIGGRTLSNDYGFLGDYILLAVNRNARKGLSASCPVYVSQMMDTKHEVKIHLALPRRAKLSFLFEIGVHISFIREILVHKYAFPHELVLRFEMARGGGWMYLDPSSTLIDYGILSSAKEINLRLMSQSTAVPAAVPLLQCVDTNGSTMKITASVGQPPSSTIASGDEADVTKKNAVASVSAVDTEKPKAKGAVGSMFKGMKKGFLSGGDKSKGKTANNSTDKCQ